MAKERFDLRLDGDDIKELIKQADKLDITPSALARIFIKNGLTEYSPEKVKLMDMVDSLQGASGAITEMLFANLFLSSRAQVMTLQKNEGESEEAYKARQGSEAMRLIKVAMGNSKTIQQNIEAK